MHRRRNILCIDIILERHYFHVAALSFLIVGKTRHENKADKRGLCIIPQSRCLLIGWELLKKMMVSDEQLAVKETGESRSL